MATPPPDPSEQQLIGLYQAAETYLITQAAVLLQRALAVGGVAAMLPQLQRLVQRTTAGLAAASPALIVAMLAHEGAAGRAHADRQVGRLPTPPADAGAGAGRTPPPGGFLHAGRGEDEPFFDLSKDHGDRAAEAIARDIESELTDVQFRLTRLPADIYKAVAPAHALGQVLDRNLTAEQAQAAAWQDFVRRGVTGFTDKSGRDWQLSSYVEMAVRTASARAFNASTLARISAIGFPYVTVPPHTHPCPLCGPWQGAVLSIGPNPDPDVDTDGTIADAVAAGLNHPNCKDTFVVWDHRTQPRPERREWTGEDELRYRATQKQRELEREIRKHKAAERAGLTPESTADARRQKRRAEAKIRAHLAMHPQLGRQSRREQPHLRMDTQSLTPWKPPPGPKPPFSDGSAPDWTAAVP